MAIFFDGDRRVWYRFETDGETITLIVDGARTTEWLAWLRTDEVRAMNAGYAEEYGLRPFIIESYSWGHGGCGRFDGEHSEDWDRISMPIPSMNLDDDKPDYTSAYECAFSMELLLRFLNKRGPTGSGRVQGLCPALGTVPHVMHGGQISAQVSPALAKWCFEVLAQGDNSFHIELDGRDDPISKVMRKACARIWGSGKRAEDNLFAATGFTLLCGRPHFSGGISGDVAMNGSATPEPSGAYEITPHNCDGPIAQFTILAGIAKLDQLFHER